MRMNSVRSVAFTLAMCAAGGTAWADDVRVAVQGKTLVIVGDADANQIVVRNVSAAKPEPVTVQVTPGGATTINGDTAAVTFDGVVDVRVGLGDGDDVFTCDTLDIGGSMKVDGGPGDDTISLTFCGFGTDLKIAGATGVLRLDLTNTEVTRNFLVKGGVADDVVTCSGCDSDRNAKFLLGPGANTFTDTNGAYSQLLVKTAGGSDSFTFDQTRVDRAVHVAMGPGVNSFVARGANFGDKLQLAGGKDDDSVQILSTSIGEDARLTLSNGNNDVIFDKMDLISFQSQVGESLLLTTGSGSDTIVIDGSTQIGEDCRILMSSGDNVLTLRNSSIGESLLVTAGSGDDSVDLTGTGIGTTQRVLLDGGTNTGP